MNPAHAGMNRKAANQRLAFLNEPRTRGDEPNLTDSEKYFVE